MRRIQVFEPIAAALVAGLWVLPAINSAAAQQQQAALTMPNKFDGVYSVDVVTKKGSCDKYRWTVAVANGRVSSRYAGADIFDVVGRIGRGGLVFLTFRGQDEVARAEGHMKGGSGVGEWSSSSLLCSGVWRAKRQN